MFGKLMLWQQKGLNNFAISWHSLWNEAYNDVRSARAQHLDVTTGIFQVLRSVVPEHTSDCSEIKQFDYRHNSWITQSAYFNFRSDFPKCEYFNIFLRSTYGSIDTFLLPVYYNGDINMAIQHFDYPYLESA